MRIANYIQPSAGRPAEAAAKTQGTSQTVKNAAPGDVIKAEVLAVGKNGMTLRLEDGSTINAVRSLPVEVAVGEQLTMLVTGQQGGALLVELADGSSRLSDVDVERLFALYGMESSPERREIAGELIRNNLSPTRERMENLAGLLAEVKDLTAGKAAFMAANGIPLDSEHAARLDALLDHTGTIGAKLAQLLTALGMAEEAPAQQVQQAQTAQAPVQPAQTPPPEAQILPQQPAGQSAQPPPDAQIAPQPSVEQAQVPTAQAVAQPETQKARAAPAQQQAVEQTAQPSQVTPAAQQGAEAQAQAPPQPQQPQMTISAPQPEIYTYTQSGRLSAQSAPQQGITEAQNLQIPQERQPAQTVQSAPPQPEQENVQSQQARQPQQTQQQPQPAQVFAQSSAPVQYDSTYTRPLPGVQAALPEIREMIDQIFTRITQERGRPLAGDLDPARTIERLNTLIDAVNSRAALLGETGRAAVTDILRSLGEQVRFAQELNSAAYVQMPIMLGEEKTTAELYVFRDPKQSKKRIDPENATMFLSLGTANMGRVESFVKLIGKHVECDFKLDADSLTFIRAHVRSLDDAFTARGYKLSRISFSERTDGDGFMQASQSRPLLERRYSIDLKV